MLDGRHAASFNRLLEGEEREKKEFIFCFSISALLYMAAPFFSSSCALGAAVVACGISHRLCSRRLPSGGQL